jgi:transcriptional/translational regulatory protein YebC/TACO1
MFDQKGRIMVDLEKAGIDEDSLMLMAIEAGAEDMQTDDGVVTILCDPSELEEVQSALAAGGVVVDSAEVARVPKTTVEVDPKNAETLLQLIEDLEENEDVSSVYANFEIPDEVMEQIASQ